MKRIYTLAELEALPTLCVGQSEDLKIDTKNVRIWLSRCTVEDGEPYNNKVTVEVLNEKYNAVNRASYRRGAHGSWIGSHWVVDYTYEAK